MINQEQILLNGVKKIKGEKYTDKEIEEALGGILIFLARKLISRLGKNLVSVYSTKNCCYEYICAYIN